MKENIVIASSKRPTDTAKFFREVISLGMFEFNVLIERGIITDGPGCYNYGFQVTGETQEDIDKFGRALCMAMMPSKWAGTKDEIPEGFKSEV